MSAKPSAFLKFALLRVLKKSPPQRYVRATDNDDYQGAFLNFPNDARSRFRILSFDENSVSGQFIGSRSDEEVSQISWDDLGDFKLEVKHMYRNLTITYGSPAEYLWGEFSLHAKRHRFLFWFRTKAYIRQLKFRDDRISLLELISEHELKDRIAMSDEILFGYEGVSQFWLFEHVYGLGVSEHPNSNFERARFDMLVDSLVHSDELILANDKVKIGGNALQTLSTHVESDRRHRDVVSQNTVIILLTLVIAVSSAVSVFFN